MDRLIVITLLALGVLSYAEEQNTAEQLSLDDLVDKLADDDFQNKLVDKFVDRAQEKLDQLDLNLEDTLLAKDAKSAPPPKQAARRAPAPAPRRKSGGPLDGFFEGLSNIANSGGGVTPTVGRAGRGNLKNTGMSELNRAVPEMSRRGFPQTVPRQNAFAGGATRRLPFEETLAEDDAQTTFASSSMLGLCVMAFFAGMAITYAAVSFRRGQSIADEDYKPM